MIDFIPYEPAHMALLDLQPAQLGILDRLGSGYAQDVHIPGMSWTGMDDGLVVGCAGFIPVWNARATAWALFSKIPPRQWPRIVRFMRSQCAQLRAKGFRRVDATVVATFGPGIHLAHLVGMQVEGRLKAYGPQGEDHFMFASVL